MLMFIVSNFVNHALPSGSLPGSNPSTGAGGSSPDAVSGALGLGPQASQGINTFNSFWIYTTPLLGAYIAGNLYNVVCFYNGV